MPRTVDYGAAAVKSVAPQVDAATIRLAAAKTG
jgi:hypothetical protein